MPQSLTRRMAAKAIALSPFYSWGNLSHSAETFPNRPLRIFVGFGPGSAPDSLARAVAVKMMEDLGQSVVVENRVTANGNVAAQQLLKEAADGHTLMLATDSLFTMNPFVLPRTSFNPLQDFSLVSTIAEGPIFLVASSGLGVSSVRELVALVKSQPGKYSYFAPTATPHHILAERFTETSGLTWVRVSYRNPQQAAVEIGSGLVPIGFVSYAQLAGSVSTGRLKVLAVSTASRLPSHPAIPTLTETFPELEESSWSAIYAAKDTPAPLVARLTLAARNARDSSDVRQQLDLLGMRALNTETLDFTARIRSEYERRRLQIRRYGIRPD